MQYSRWGGRADGPLVSKLGFGTTRFRTEDLQDERGIGRCAELVSLAIEKGVNYFDVSPTYAYGQAEKILGLGFSSSPRKKVYVSGKTGLMIDRTSDDVLRRIDQSLAALKIDQIDFYHIWSVMNYAEYQEIRKQGGVFDGVGRAKEQGMIKRICISLHCTPEDTLKIIGDGLFEGITISMNALNYEKWLPVLKEARDRHMGVATMNSLAGGVIPQYHKLFEPIDRTDDSVPIKALRFLASFPEVDVALSGMATAGQIEENCRAFDTEAAVHKGFRLETKETLCSGCNYCAPCTVGIPISACMQGYNHKILVESAGEVPEGRRLANEVFIRLRANGVSFPETSACIGCRRCERRCTQKLDITGRLKWLADMADSHGYTLGAMRRRFEELERECADARHIAIWPACDYATRTLDLWANPEFEKKCEFFNSSPAMWGKGYRGKKIRKPSELESLGIDTVIIMHYRLQEEIKEELLKGCRGRYQILGLHKEEDIDWFNRAAGS